MYPLITLLFCASAFAQTLEPFTDPRDDKTYRTVKIGTQVWMAENLNYNAENSKCYNNDTLNCKKYGRLYNWTTAMALPDSCGTARTTCARRMIKPKHQGICPAGWHIPTNAEWNKLLRYVDGKTGTDSFYSSDTAGKHLKATDGWNSGGNGDDTYGFAALPGGYGATGEAIPTTVFRLDGLPIDIHFTETGYKGSWWTASESYFSHGNRVSYGAYVRGMWCGSKGAGWYEAGKSIYLHSVRCVRD